MGNEDIFEQMLYDVSIGRELSEDERNCFYDLLLERSKNNLDKASDCGESISKILSQPMGKKEISLALNEYTQALGKVSYLIDDWKIVKPFATRLFPSSIEDPEKVVYEKIGLYQEFFTITDKKAKSLEIVFNNNINRLK